MNSSASNALRRVKKHRPQCPQCGERRFRRDPDTASVVCRNGHVLQGFLEEENDAGDEYYSPAASQSLMKRKRHVRRQRNPERNRHSRDSQRLQDLSKQIWHGDRERFLYHQCLQLTLRLQIEALQRNIPGLPQEFEAVCRDLWAFYVSLQSKLRPQPYLEAHSERMEEASNAGLDDNDDDDDGNATSQSKARRRAESLRLAARADLEAIIEEEERISQRIDDDMQSMGISEDEHDDVQSESDVDLSGLDSESEMEIDNSESGNASDGARRRRKTYRVGENSGLYACLSILYLAFVTLRVPIFWADLRALILEGKLPYLHVVYRLPPSMTKHLARRSAFWLDQKRVPSIQQLTNRTAVLARQLHNNFDIAFPQVNCLPMLWRCSERLLLPPTFYRAAKRLLSYIDVPMYPVDAGSCIHLHDGGVYEGRLNSFLHVNTTGRQSLAREIVLMAAVVFAAKMRYGLDGEERFEDAHESEFWAGAPTLDAWLAALDENGEALCYSHARQIADPSVLDVLDMTDAQLDEYLDYVERNLVLTEQPNAFASRRNKPAQLDDLLGAKTEELNRHAMQDGEEGTTDDKSMWKNQVEQVRRCTDALYKDVDSLAPPTTQEELDANMLRPGEAHNVYSRSKAIHHDGFALAEVPIDFLVHPTYASVLRHASRVIDCDVNVLSDAISALEVRLIKRLLHRQRAGTEKRRYVKRKGKRKREESTASMQDGEQGSEGNDGG